MTTVTHETENNAEYDAYCAERLEEDAKYYRELDREMFEKIGPVKFFEHKMLAQAVTSLRLAYLLAEHREKNETLRHFSREQIKETLEIFTEKFDALLTI